MEYSKPYIGRLLAALNHKKGDRVPNWDVLVDDRSLKYLLKRPPGGERETTWSVPPEEAVIAARAVGQDSIVCSMTWGLQEASILTEKDLDKVVPPEPVLARKKLEKYLAAVKGTDMGVCARLSGPMTLTYMALGPVPIESFMYLLYDNPVLVKRLMEIFTAYHIRLIEAIKDLPYHFYYIGDDIGSTAGPLVSPESLKEFWVPKTKQLIDAARGSARPVIFHCCGVQAPILPYMVEWGVNAVHPVQPVANDIYAVREKYGSRLTLVGNIDVAGVLSFGTPAQVRESVREHIERLAKDGSYVVCSSHSIIDSVPPENYIAMTKAAQEFGIFK